MDQGFTRVSILGGGLLGSSIAMAMKERGVQGEIWARRESGAKEIESSCGVRATTDMAEAVQGAELIIMATPVGVMEQLAQKLIDLNCQALVTDVGSVKRLPHQTAGTLLSQAGIDFIGSHPMAGSEKKGCQGARLDLLSNAACVITNESAPVDLANRLGLFWKSLGCRIFEMSAQEHDEKVARISHFPHLLASLCAELGLNFEQATELSGGGMRDTSRVASGDPKMWAEILSENADGLESPIQEAIEKLQELQQQLKTADQSKIESFLQSAKDRRDQLS